MQKDLLVLAKNHFRLGYTRALLIPDLFFLSLILIDVVNWRIETGSLERVWYAMSCFQCAASELTRPAGPGGVPPLRSLVVFAIFMMVGLPLVLGVVRVVSSRQSRHMDVVRKPLPVLVTHLAFSAFFVYCFIAALAMRNLAGLELTGELTEGTYQYVFNPLLLLIVTLDVFRWTLMTFLSLVSSAISLVVFGVLAGRQMPPALKQYMVRAELADLPSELRPLPGPTDTSPPIAAVNERASELARKYYSLASEPHRASDWLDEKWDKCEQLIHKTLFEPGATNTHPEGCELFTVAGGAIDAVLAELPRPRLIVVCPYASPQLRQFLEWRARWSGDQVVSLALEPNEYSLDWTAQQMKMVQATEAALRSHAGGALVVLSEVSYASGRRLLMPELLRRLKEALPDREFRVAVDGTNAAGNRGRIRADAGWDYYVFAPNAWLLAPEPCEILLSKKARNSQSPAPGLWRKGAAKSNEEIMTLLGLSAALELIDRSGLEYFWQRSERLCRESRLTMPGNVSIVGDNSGTLETFIVTCSPRSSWRLESDELEKMIGRKSLPVSLLRLDPKGPWVRVRVPYYMDFQELRRVFEFLGEVAR